MIDFPKIVFHGSSLPPGTDSTELRKPRLEQPLFVGDDISMALWYADIYKSTNWYTDVNNDTNVTRTPSIFIFKLKESSKNLLFNMENYDDYKRLKSKFPNFVKYLQYKFVDDETFFDAISVIATMACYQWFFEKDEKFRKSFPYNINWGKTTMLKVDAAIELGIAELSGDGKKQMVVCAPEVEKIVTATGCNDNGITKVRRYAKAKIYKEIYDLGFRIVKDGDTTTDRKNSRSEYAILDMDIIESGINKSMSLDTAKRKLKKIEKEFENHGNEGGVI